MLRTPVFGGARRAPGGGAQDASTGALEHSRHAGLGQEAHGDGLEPQAAVDRVGRDAEPAQAVVEAPSPLGAIHERDVAGEREDQRSTGTQYADELPQVGVDPVAPRHVLEDDRAVHEVEPAVLELVQVGVGVDAELAPRPIRVELARAFDHPRRDVDADAVVEAIGEGARQPSQPAPEVQRLGSLGGDAERLGLG